MATTTEPDRETDHVEVTLGWSRRPRKPFAARRTLSTVHPATAPSTLDASFVILSRGFGGLQDALARPGLHSATAPPRALRRLPATTRCDLVGIGGLCAPTSVVIGLDITGLKETSLVVF